ncbi:S8 family serine peptidase [Gallaecimonas sp. GXIMD1310]|uniref:S8 family serine peptidase n=1 Tax=Gallaecimonas sp. GXIMD1310 TaxID=3131926 RepID=UPI0032569C92
MTNKTLLSLAICAAIAGGSAQAALLDKGKAPQQQAATDAVLVVFKQGIDRTDRIRVVRSAGGNLHNLDAAGRDSRFKHLLGGRLAKVALAAGADRDAVLKKLAANPAVALAEPDFRLHALVNTPDDPSFSSLWGMNNTGQDGGTADADIDAPEAWAISTGSADVVVGVIDSGVDYTHPDLANNIWTNPGEIAGNGIDDDGNGVIDDVHGFSAISGAGDPMDDNGHGTHVSGTIGAQGNNAMGVVGVNWDVSIIGCKFLDASGSGYTSDAISCLNYFTDLKQNHGINVRATNNSWGGGSFSQALKDAIDDAGNAGILFVAAAGNDSSDIDASPSYPGSYDSAAVLTVASTDRNDAMSWFSNYGASSVDLGAPGSDILSTIPGGSYGTASGTSMASPHVAGAAALVWSVNPALSISEMKALLMDSGDTITAMNGTTVSGKRLNLKAALDAADPTPGFSVSLSPASQQIIAGDTASYSLDVGSIADWTGTVNFTVSSSPALPGVSLSASSASPGDTLTLTVPTSSDTDWGLYQLTVSGDNGDMQREVSATLSVLPQGLQDYPYSNDTAAPIPDNDANGMTSTIEVAESGVVFGIDVAVNISHTWVGDLLIKLTSPAGTEYVLHNREGGDADNLIKHWLLTAFNGEPMQGTWTLFVSDNAGADTGTLNSWDLVITAVGEDMGPSAPTAAFSASVDGLNVSFADASSDRDGDISSWLWDFGDGSSATTANPTHSYAAGGSYTVTLTVTDATGLTDTATQTVTVSDTVIAVTVLRSYVSRRGSALVDLRWQGASGDMVDIYRNGVLISTTNNDGRYRDRFQLTADSASYQICNAGTDYCSEPLTVNF